MCKEMSFTPWCRPQPALSVEVEPDVLLRYVPPRLEVVGCTLINFLTHFPCPPPKTPLEHAMAVVEELLRKYPQVPCEGMLPQA